MSDDEREELYLWATSSDGKTTDVLQATTVPASERAQLGLKHTTLPSHHPGILSLKRHSTHSDEGKVPGHIQSLAVAEMIKPMVDQAMSAAKAFFDDIIQKGVGELVKVAQDLITKALDVLKAKLQKFADSALAFLKDGVKTLADKLKAVPSSVSTTVSSICKLLPESIQSTCSTGVTQIVANVQKFISQMCTNGVKGLMASTSKTCESGATIVQGLFAKANSGCLAGTNPLPSMIKKPLQDACGNVTTQVADVPEQICTKLRTGTLEASAGVCSALASAKAPAVVLADVPDRLQMLAQTITDGVVRDTAQKFSKVAHPPLTQLLSLDDLKQGITDAIAKAKEIFNKALEGAIGEVSGVVAAKLGQAMDSVKKELAAQADKAVAVATDALAMMTTTLSNIPSTIQKKVAVLCQPLGDMAESCSTGAKEIVVNATGVIGTMCQSGVAAMLESANKTLRSAAATAEKLIKSAGGLCAKACSALPANLADPIMKACTNATETVAKVPGQVIDDALSKAKAVLGAACSAVSGAAKTRALSRTTALEAVKMQQLLPSQSSVAQDITAAMSDAKAQVSKILLEATTAAASKITQRMTAAMIDAMEPLKQSLREQVNKAVSTATSGLAALKTTLAKIPTTIKSAVEGLCNMLPDLADLKAVCSTGLQGILKNASGVVVMICQSGMDVATGMANKSVQAASTAFKGSITSFSTVCTQAGSSAPEPLRDSIGTACANLTQALGQLPGDVMVNATVRVKEATNGVCQSIGLKSQLHRSVLVLRSMRVLHKVESESDHHFLWHPAKARLEQLMDSTAIETAITEAVASAKEIFAKYAKQAVAEAIEAIGPEIDKAMASIKAELMTQAQKASAVATEGLGKMKNTLWQIPSKIKGLIETMCKTLPGDELQANCTGGSTAILKNTTGIVAGICKQGVNATIGLASKTCLTAASAAKDLLSKAGALCATVTSGLPAELIDPAAQACSNATQAATDIPSGACKAALVKATEAAHGVCDAIQASASYKSSYAQLTSATHTSVLALHPPSVQSLLSLPTLSLPDIDFTSILSQAKTMISKAVVEAAGKIVPQLETVVSSGVDKAKSAVSEQVEAAVTKARPAVAGVVSKAVGVGRTAFSKCIDLTKNVPSMGQGMAVTACKAAAGKAVDAAKSGCDKAADTAIEGVSSTCQKGADKLVQPIQDALASPCQSMLEPLKDICSNATGTVAHQAKDIPKTACQIVTAKAAPLKSECNGISMDNLTAGVKIPEGASGTAADTAMGMAKGLLGSAGVKIPGGANGSAADAAMGMAKGLAKGLFGSKCPPCPGDAPAPSGVASMAKSLGGMLGRRLLSRDTSSWHDEDELEQQLEASQSLFGMPKLPVKLPASIPGMGGDGKCPPCPSTGSGSSKCQPCKCPAKRRLLSEMELDSPNLDEDELEHGLGDLQSLFGMPKLPTKLPVKIPGLSAPPPAAAAAPAPSADDCPPCVCTGESPAAIFPPGFASSAITPSATRAPAPGMTDWSKREEKKKDDPYGLNIEKVETWPYINTFPPNMVATAVEDKSATTLLAAEDTLHTERAFYHS